MAEPVSFNILHEFKERYPFNPELFNEEDTKEEAI